MSPALKGGFSSTEPSRKFPNVLFYIFILHSSHRAPWIYDMISSITQPFTLQTVLLSFLPFHYEIPVLCMLAFFFLNHIWCLLNFLQNGIWINVNEFLMKPYIVRPKLSFGFSIKSYPKELFGQPSIIPCGQTLKLEKKKNESVDQNSYRSYKCRFLKYRLA